MIEKLREYVLAFLIVLFYWVLSRTWRWEHVGFPEAERSTPGKVYAHWHGDELLLVGVKAHSRMAVMTSHSRDGRLMARVLRWLGYSVVKGSSSRGGAAGLKGLIDAMEKKNVDVSLAVDGPRGPLYRVKPGILTLAQKTGRPILPGAAACNRRYTFKKSWNRCYLPLPFARCTILYGEPLGVPKDLTEDEFEALRKVLEERLLNLKHQVEGLYQSDYLEDKTISATVGV